MSQFGKLVKGDVDFSDWDFDCGPFNTAIGISAEKKIKFALSDSPPYIYFPSLHEDDSDKKPLTPALTIRLWLDALGKWNDQDAGPQYEFSLEKLLRDMAADGEDNAREIFTALRILATELESIMLAVE